MAHCLGSTLLLLLLLGSASWAAGNRCVDAAEACTADSRCQQLRAQYVAQCLGRAAEGGCPRSRCRRALRLFFARGPPAHTLALLFCPCASPTCAERRRQTFVPTCAFSRPGAAPPSCLEPRDACERSRVCRPRLLAFQASCVPAPGTPDGCLHGQGARCLRAYAGLVGTAVTPNYMDNSSARVAPWCDCGASGNRREDCEAFRGLFTRNPCLGFPGDLCPAVFTVLVGAGPKENPSGVEAAGPVGRRAYGAIRAFDRIWSPVLQGKLDSHQDPKPSFMQVPSAGGPLAGSLLFALLPTLALQDLL